MKTFRQFLKLYEELAQTERDHFNSILRDPKAIAATDHYFVQGNED